MNDIVWIIYTIVKILLLIVFLILYGRNRTETKVLREAKLDLDETVQKQKQAILQLEKNIPMELYRDVVKEENGKFKLTPSHQSYSIMEMNTDGFSMKMQEMPPEKLFQFINQLLEKTVSYVYQKQGMIEFFDRAGFNALFTGSCEEALEAAVSITEMIENETEKSDLFQNFSVGLTYGTVLAGLAGCEQRMSLITVSEHSSVAAFLRSIARKYDARLLITETFRARITGFEGKFHARRLGYIYISAANRLEEVYEVYDGAPVKVRNSKQKTKIVFEKGVAFYGKGDYEKARQYFIEVCKTNRYDGAAKEYLMRCEKNLSEPSGATCVPQIEAF